MRVLVVTVAIIFMSIPALAQSKKARKTLDLVKQADGAGSGLDADTVRGFTPDYIIAEVGRRLERQVAQTQMRVTTLPLSDGQCDCAVVACEQARDILVDCGGVTDLQSGILTAMSRQIAVEACEACGCAVGGPGSVAATALCVDLTP